MSDQNQLKPYDAFLAQGRLGNSRLWGWLATFWLAIVLWVYGQLVLGTVMTGFAAQFDPESVERLQSMSMDLTGSQIMALLLSLLLVSIAPVIAILLYALRSQFQPPARRIIMRLAGGCAALSTAGLVYMILNSGSSGEEMEIVNSWIAQSPMVYLCILLMFPPMAIGLWLGVKHVQMRPILSLHTAASRFRWRRLFFSMGVFWTIALTLSVFGHFSGLSKAEFVFDASRFWAYLPVTLLFIPMQSATEEIALRGFLNQGLGQIIKNPWVVFTLTSAAFAALHLSNPEVAEGSKDAPVLLVISGYFFFGMFACVLTYIDGGLETAIGVHAANNMFAAAFMGYENSALPVPTVFRTGLDTQLDSIMTFTALSLVCAVMYYTRRPIE